LRQSCLHSLHMLNGFGSLKTAGMLGTSVSSRSLALNTCANLGWIKKNNQV
jgi:hypothetical protein